MIRALVVDDEALAREGVRLQLQRYSDIAVVAEAFDGPQGIEAIATLRPDLVFLDIRIPGFDGFEVMRRAAAVHLPIVVFVTAYDNYAVSAFDAHAIHYLVKPIQADRFREAITRVRQTLAKTEEQRAFRQQLLQLIESRDAVPPDRRPIYYRRFTVRQGKRFMVLNAGDVTWFQAASNYVELHVCGREHLLRVTLNELEHKLDPLRFVRIHRSTIVNVERIAFIEPTHNGDFSVLMTDGSVLRLSRIYRDRVMMAKWPN